MSSFVEPHLLPASRTEHWTRPEEQVGWRLSDARLERRERATKRAKDLKGRTGGRDD